MSAKLTIEQMQALAKKRGGVCLSKRYDGTHTKLRWRCAEGHEWEMTKADGQHSTELPPNFIGCAVARESKGLRGVGVDQSF